MSVEAIKGRRLLITEGAGALLPRRLRAVAREIALREVPAYNLVVGVASEFLNLEGPTRPRWIDAHTRYLIVTDVPPQAMVRLPASLELRKPHLRLHASPDDGVVTRFVLAQTRDAAWEGIIDAYTLDERLVVVLGDLTEREFPQNRLPRVGRLDARSFASFEIDTGGSFLYWPTIDTHLGPSQMLQAADPSYLADVEVDRYAREKVSLVLLDMREERGLRQSDIPGLSERHVRRLEKEKARLSVEAAEAFAEAFGMELHELLHELGKRLSRFDECAPSAPSAPERESGPSLSRVP